MPFAATGTDLALLGLLGVAQLAIPCLIAVAAARYLSAPEAALLSLLEIVFGVTWTWLGAGEVPGRHVLVGGALVIGALVANEALALRRAHAEHDLTMSPPRQPGLGRAPLPAADPAATMPHASPIRDRMPRPRPPQAVPNTNDRASSAGSLAACCSKAGRRSSTSRCSPPFPGCAACRAATAIR